MSYKIISKRSSFIERSVTFEVNGDLKTVSAPSANATFDDLIAQIESKYGDTKKTSFKEDEQKESISKTTVKVKKKSNANIKEDD